jgi:hypothetical protein
MNHVVAVEVKEHWTSANPNFPLVSADKSDKSMKRIPIQKKKKKKKSLLYILCSSVMWVLQS